MESALMIYYVPEEEELEDTQKLLETVSAETHQDNNASTGISTAPEDRLLENALARYRYRIVRTHEEFLEKLAIFDSGLDDRVIELAKVILGAEAERQLSGYSFLVKDAFFTINTETKERNLVFLDKNSSRTATVSFDQSVANVYNRIIERYSAALEGPHKNDTIIDRNWASDILKEEGKPQAASDASTSL